MTTTKNLLFDLGNVLLDLHPQAFKAAFRELLGDKYQATFDYFRETRLLDRLETGQIEPDQFFTTVREHIGNGTTIQQLETAWNTMLGELPAHRLDMLRQLSQHYRIFLLSNTNAIHMRQFDGYLQERYALSLTAFTEEFFEYLYFSHELRLAKPDLQIYRSVVEHARIRPEETLFIDDKMENIESARQVGLRGYHHDPEKEIGEVIFGVL